MPLKSNLTLYKGQNSYPPSVAFVERFHCTLLCTLKITRKKDFTLEERVKVISVDDAVVHSDLQ